MRRNSLRDKLIGVVLFCFFLLGMGGLIAATGWTETMEALADLSLMQVLILLVCSLVNYLFRGGRWHILARAIGINTQLGQSLRHFLGGFAMTVTPGRLGELVRIRWIGLETGAGAERSAPLVLMDRAADLAAMSLILGLVLLFTPMLVAIAPILAVVALAASILVTRPGLMRQAGDLGYRITRRWPRLFVKIRRAAKALRPFSQISVLIPVLSLTAIGWLAECLAFWLLLEWMGADVALLPAIVIFVLSMIAGGLSGMPGGLGGAEATMIALLSLSGVPLALAIPATAVIRLTSLWFAIAIGIVMFPIAERAATKPRKRMSSF